MGSIYRRRNKDKDGRSHLSKIWWLQYYVRGRKVRESSGSSVESVAKRLLKEREGVVARREPVIPNMERTRFDELLDDLVIYYQVHGFRTLDSLKRRIRLHIEPFFRNARALSITPADVMHFIARRQNAGASAAEINRELSLVKRAFTLAIENGKLLRRPKFSMLREKNARSGFFETHQIEAVLRNLDEDLRPMIHFAWKTGWRVQSEIQPLTWSQVSFEEGTVRLDPNTTKNDEARTFPMTEEIRGLLMTQKQRTEAIQRKLGTLIPWIFHRSGRPIKDFRGSWKAACRGAGCPGRIPHDLRRTAVRNLVRAGVPERVAMQLTGHRSRSVFERYNIVSEGDLRLAIEKLEQAGGQR